MQDVIMTKTNYKRILRIYDPIHIGILEHKINFHIDAKDRFYLLSGLWKNLNEFVSWLHKGHQYVECYVDLYDSNFVILHFEEVYGDEGPVEVHPIGEGADLLLEKLKELRDEYNSQKEHTC